MFAFRPCLTFGLLLVCVWFCVPCVRFFVFGLGLFSCVCVYHLFDLIRCCFSECDRTTPRIAMRLLSLLVLLLLLPSPRTSCERDAQRIKQNVRRFACVEVRCVPLKGCNNSHKHSNCKQSLLDHSKYIFIRPACYLRRAAIERMGIRSIRAPQPAPTRGQHSLIMNRHSKLSQTHRQHQCVCRFAAKVRLSVCTNSVTNSV